MIEDVRGIANFVLDMAAEAGHSCTNMALNKLVYFAYEDCLLNSKLKLTSAKIEAWEHGPVFREIYHCFKEFGDSQIQGRATKLNPATGKLEKCSISNDELKQVLRNSLEFLIKQSASKLRNLSHLPGSPWDEVWNHEKSSNAGMQITDEVIFRCFERGWSH